MERRTCERPCCAVVADDSLRCPGRHPLARCLLPRLQDKPSDRYPDAGPSSARISWKLGAWPAVLLVWRRGAYARANRIARVAAGSAAQHVMTVEAVNADAGIKKAAQRVRRPGHQETLITVRLARLRGLSGVP